MHFIHIADIHFGTENYGFIDAKTGLHTRLLDFQHALQQCVTYTIEHQADFFLFCGDAYKTAYPTPTQQKLLLALFLQLYRAHIPVVIIVGNHDHPLSFGKTHALDIFGSLPINGFYVIHKPGLIRIPTRSGKVQIVGIPWPTKSLCTFANQALNTTQISHEITRTISTLIKNFTQELDSSIPAILAGHLSVSSGKFSGSEKRALHGSDPVFLPSQLALEPFCYVALGHLHRHQIINSGQTPPIVYAGSIERIDFGERHDDKGFCSVYVQKNEQKNIYQTIVNFIKLDTRACVQIDVVIPEQVPNQTEYMINEIKKHEITDTIIKITYQLAPGQRDLVDLKMIQQACLSAHYIAGIQAIRHIQHKEQRSQAKLDMSLEHVLHEYFKQKPELHARSAELINKIMALKDE